MSPVPTSSVRADEFLSGIAKQSDGDRVRKDLRRAVDDQVCSARGGHHESCSTDPSVFHYVDP
jgi:hypothetical protein